MELVKIDFLWTFCTVESDPLILNKGTVLIIVLRAVETIPDLFFFLFPSHLGSLIFKNNSTFVTAPFSVATVRPQPFIKLTEMQ